MKKIISNDIQIETCVERGEFVATPTQVMELNISHKKEVKQYDCNYHKKQLPNWNIEISELEAYFAAGELPSQSVRLNKWSNIINLPLFIESHFATVKANNGVNIFLPHLSR
ncbi:MAG: hypothetical protein Q7U47_01115, partial [Paludibacter sp.]|nr:hypothetical protein [Paludibacter sp.]